MIMCLAENENEMRSMIERLEEYQRKKNLELNTEKTKIMRFRKGVGKVEKKEWKWTGKKIQEVKQYGYLEYMVQNNGRQETHIRDRVKRGAAVMGQV